MKQPDAPTSAEPVTEEASPPPEKDVDVTFSFVAGRLFRDDIIFQTKSLAMRCGIQIEVAENRGWLESAYMVRVSGKHAAVSVFCDSWNEWQHRLRAG